MCVVILMISIIRHSKIEMLKDEMKNKVKLLRPSSSYITVDGHAPQE